MAARNTGLIRIEGLNEPVLVRKNKRAKRLTLRVSHTDHQAVLTLPASTSPPEAKAFVQKHKQWLKRQLEERPSTVLLTDGAIIPLRGEAHKLRFCEKNNASRLVEISAHHETPIINVSGAPKHSPRRFLDWLKKEARNDITARSAWHAKNLGLTIKRISIRDQKSRWGSCSSTSTLSYSWRLILAPPLVLDYVTAHEVAHLAEMNHGPRFWSLVRSTMPEMEKAKSWLKSNGASLHRYQLP